MNTIRKGSKGRDVEILQACLRTIGIKGKNNKDLDIDGDCGDNTIYAINQFQKLTATMGVNTGNGDSVFGANCWKFLLR